MRPAYLTSPGTWVRPHAECAAPTADQARAARLYPNNPSLQSEWLRAVALVRRTARGWLLERPFARESA